MFLTHVLYKCPLDGGLEEEEEECISDANELTAKEEFSVEENFPADFEPDSLTCEDMEYFCSKGVTGVTCVNLRTKGSLVIFGFGVK
ncbi:hypothetical protein cypCar_00044695 [Cyprinus carpio]|nr:hypothetical protein cypCar_00044695 [Cyprinus carpio]